MIDAKHYKGRIEVRKPLFRAEAVQSALDSVAPGAPMHACFCFIHSEGQSIKLLLLRTLSVSGYPLLYPRKLAKRLKQPGGAKRRADAAGRGSVGAGVSGGLSSTGPGFGGGRFRVGFGRASGALAVAPTRAPTRPTPTAVRCTVWA